MDVTVQLPTDPVERRRAQNRIAQRKFRHKRLQNQTAMSSATNTRPLPSRHSWRTSSNTLTQATSTPHVPNALQSPSLVGCIDLGMPRPDGLPTTPATVSIDGLDMYFDSNFDACFDIPSLPTEPPGSSLSFEQDFSPQLCTLYPGLLTPQATASASYAAPSSSSPSSSGRSQETPVSDRVPVSSVSSVLSQPSSRRCTVIDMPTVAADASPGVDAGSTTGENDDGDAKCDKGWISTIHIAVQSGNERILGMLLRQDTEGINCPDSNGRTPLFHGAIQDSEPVVHVLLAHGARIGVLDKEGRSPLHWAVLYRRLEVLRMLLDHWNRRERDTFDIDAHDNVGWTPLHLAVERRFEAGVLLLMQNGANIKARAKMCPHTGKAIPFNVEPLSS